MNRKIRAILFAITGFILLSGNACQEFTYSEAVNMAKASPTLIYSLYDEAEDDAEDNNSTVKEEVVEEIRLRLGRLTGITQYNTPELRDWLMEKSDEELENIYIHLYVASGDEFMTARRERMYFITGFTQEDYVIPEGMTNTQYLQLLLTTSL